jgi:hypothetical protein
MELSSWVREMYQLIEPGSPVQAQRDDVQHDLWVCPAPRAGSAGDGCEGSGITSSIRPGSFIVVTGAGCRRIYAAGGRPGRRVGTGSFYIP